MTPERELHIKTLEIAAIMLGPASKKPVRIVNGIREIDDETIQPYLNLAQYLEERILADWKD